MSESDGSSEIKYVKSSYSGGSGDCVEVGKDPATGLIAVRHSMRPGIEPLFFNDREWIAFLKGANMGEFQPDILPK